MPKFSLVIAVYNDWDLLEQSLESIAAQASAPAFEVIVVDDGSAEPMPTHLLDWAHAFPLTTVRRPHAGISTARNTGIRLAQGSVLLFIDADSRLKENCLAALDATIAAHPEHNSFQLRLIGDRATLPGRTEELRLSALQAHMLQANGCMRYLNTAGFAIRREKVDIEKGLFDPAAVRGEDTLLLANLIQCGQLPFFAADAVVQHAVSLTLLQCIRKNIRSAYLEANTYQTIASRGIRVRMNNRERLRMLRTMWRASRRRSIRRPAWFALLISQALQRVVSLAFSYR
jgi:glycosyltransferase involved in cell wall biosynthesis